MVVVEVRRDNREDAERWFHRTLRRLEISHYHLTLVTVCLRVPFSFALSQGGKKYYGNMTVHWTVRLCHSIYI